MVSRGAPKTDETWAIRLGAHYAQYVGKRFSGWGQLECATLFTPGNAMKAAQKLDLPKVPEGVWEIVEVK